jgi:hypothetical protein
MPYTQADLDSVRNARIALATGKRVVQASVGGKSIQYALTDLPELERFENAIKAELQNAANRRRFILTTTWKGL